jgi:transposase
MPRTFKTVDYEATLNLNVSIRECLPPEHLARLIVGIMTQLDLSSIYAGYGKSGGKALAPEILLSLLFYGYATGVFSSRAIERATYESIPFRFLAGNLHPDHDTIAHFRQRFLPQIKDLFVQVLLLATDAGVLKLENVSVDGTKINADASKSKAVSHKRLLELQIQLEAEVEALLQLAQQADGAPLPANLKIEAEVARRRQQLENLTLAKAVLAVRAQERYEAEKALV